MKDKYDVPTNEGIWKIPRKDKLNTATDKIDMSVDKIDNREFYFVTGLCVGALITFVTFTSLLMWE